MLDLIFALLYSNDYISRTITIKIICELAEFFQDRFEILHQVNINMKIINSYQKKA